MKVVVISIMLCAVCLLAKAQTPFTAPVIPMPVNNTSHDIVAKVPPYYIVKSNGMDYTIDADSYNQIKKEWILKAQHIKNDDITAAYGPAAANGINIITLNDKAHPEAYTTLKKYLTPIK